MEASVASLIRQEICLVCKWKRSSKNPMAGTACHRINFFTRNNSSSRNHMSIITKEQLLQSRNCPTMVDWPVAIITMLAIFFGVLYSATIGGTRHLLFASPGFLLMFALAISTISDLAHRKIYNCVTLPVFLFVIGVNVVASYQTTVDSGISGLLNGTVGIVSSAAGAFLCFLIVFAAYLKSGCGAGDVKLATIIGAVLGVRFGVWAVMYSYLAAFAFFVVPVMFWKLAILRNADESKHSKQSKQSMLPMAPFFAIGTLYVVVEAGL